MPAQTFLAQKISARNLVLSPNKQAAFGTPLADEVLTRRQRFDGSAMFELTQSRRSDKAYAGKGTEFATDGQLTGWDSKFSLKAELDGWLAGWAFAMAMGKETVTGAAAPFTHAFAFDESSLYQAATTIYLEDTQDVHYKLADLAVADITINIPDRGACTLDMSLAGTGFFTRESMEALPALDTAVKYLLANDCQFSIGPQANPVDITGRHMSTTLKISTGVEAHIAPGGGLYGVFMRHGVYSFNIQSVIAAKESDDIFTLAENDTLCDLKWTINSGAHSQLIFEAAAAKVKAAKIGKSGQNMVVWNIELDDTSSFAQGGKPALAVSVVNDVEAYLATS